MADARTELLAAKIEHAWGSSVGEKGYGAPDEVAERLYDSIFRPEHVVTGIEERRPQGARATELRASTREALEVRVPMGPAPDRAEFVRTVSDTIVRDVPAAPALLPGAREGLVELDRRGVLVAAWSAGEPKHQHHKLAGIGLVDPAIARTVSPRIEVSRQFGEPLSVSTAIAPDKTVASNMQRVADLAGGRHLVVADDRTKNLVAFQNRFPGATALWVQYGAHAAKAVAKLERGEDPALARAIDGGGIVPVRAIGDLVPTVERLQRDGQLPGYDRLMLATDVDDTLLNNDLRRDLQHTTTLEVIQSRGWVAEPAAKASGPERTAAVQAAPKVRPVDRGPEASTPKTNASSVDATPTRLRSETPQLPDSLRTAFRPVDELTSQPPRTSPPANTRPPVAPPTVGTQVDKNLRSKIQR